MLRTTLAIALAACAVAVAPAATAARPKPAAALTLDGWARRDFAGLWRFNHVKDGNETYGVLRLNPDGTTFAQSGGRTAEGAIFDGVPMTGRWTAALAGNGTLVIQVETGGERRTADLYTVFDDGSLRQGELIFERLEQ